MTNKFNVGDKVVPVEDLSGYGFPKGEVVEVINVYAQGTTRIRNKRGREGTFFNSRLQLAELKPTKNQRITALEETVVKQAEQINELQIIVAQIRKPSTVVREAIDKAVLESGEGKSVIQFEGKQYKKVDREAREGDVVIMTAQSESDVIYTGRPYKVDENKQIEGFDVYRHNHGLNRTPETVDVYELIVEDKPFDWVDYPLDEEKSPNQLRAEIIEKAKGFVEDSKVELTLNRGRGYVVPFEKGGEDGYICEVQFEVNVDKRTVVALLRWTTEWESKIKAKGIAKCMPGDVFNEHIGKAIALGRALGLDVSEFEGAVQPSEVVVGTYTHHFKNGELSFEHTVVDEEDAKETNAEQNSCGWTFKIINDTNAQYGGVE